MAGERILVVDDGQENLDFVVEYILQPEGYEALTAKDGEAGLKMAITHKPDLILLDLQMPRMNGIQVLKALAARKMDIPVILMTFHGSEEIAIEVYRLGVRDYIKKPYSIEEMLEAIERSLTETRLRREKEALTERLIQANRDLQLRLQELNVLYSVGKNVAALLEMNQLLPRVVDAATQITHAEEGYLYLVQNARLVCMAQKRRGSRPDSGDNINDQVAAHIVEQGQPLVLGAEQLGNTGTVSIVGVPVILRDEVIGVLEVRNVTAGTHIFTTYHSALLSALSDYVAISIENARNFALAQQIKEQEKDQIRNTFKRFVHPFVVDQVLEDPATLQLGGKRKDVTIMFADIRGYTAYSENAPPEQVLEMLNDYLSLAANVILSYNGTLDKYMGDGLMAIFNAPQDQPDHVYLAAEAAMMLQSAAAELAQQRGDHLTFGVGISVGEAVVGYIGTYNAVNYTAIGDTVNLAKRLQENARPGQVLTDETVMEKLGTLAQGQKLGTITLRGRQKQVLAYELQAVVPSRERAE
jgi:class 3 adenylate cyclase/DNA-binding response OmpR family regulator